MKKNNMVYELIHKQMYGNKNSYKSGSYSTTRHHNRITLHHYGTPIWFVNFLRTGETLNAGLFKGAYSASDRDAINTAFSYFYIPLQAKIKNGKLFLER